MRQNLQEFWLDEDGAVAIEYSLLVGLLGLGIVVSMTSLSSSLADLFVDIQDGIKAALGSG